MVLSIAFILAFVISAIVLLIGILIFSDVSEAMALTLPVSTFVAGTGITTNDNALYGCTPPSSGNSIHLINKLTGNSISSNTIVVAGLTVQGCNGLAVDPTTGTFYAIIKHQANGTDRHLVTIDPTTGIGNDLGGMGDTHAGLGFLADGSLRSVVGFASADVYQYFSVDKTNGQTTKLCKLPTAVPNTGQALTLNYDNNKIYHHTGSHGSHLTLPEQGKFSTVDNEGVDPCGVTDIPDTTSDFGFAEIFALAYSTDDGLFYVSSFNKWHTVTPSGNEVTLNTGQSPNEQKGLAFAINLGGGGSGTPLTPDEQNQVDTFNQALNVAFTVIGILPVALFFALFAIFSGRTGTE